MIRLAMELADHPVSTAKEVYWNFEAYLNALNSALDLLARCVGVAYREDVPVSFNKLCARQDLSGPVDVLRRAQVRWVRGMKDLRDCFAHYTPPETVLTISAVRYSDGWQAPSKYFQETQMCVISRNLGIRVAWSCSNTVGLWKRINALDKSLAKELSQLYSSKNFPKRTHDLFVIGQRSRKV